MPLPDVPGVCEARKIVKSFHLLMTRLEDNTEILEPGQLLLVAFNSLFDKVDDAFAELGDNLKKLDTDPAWIHGVEGIENSFKIIPLGFSKNAGFVKGLAELSTTLNRLVVLREYFRMCTKCMRCFKGDPAVIGQLFPVGDEIARPVKLFATEYFR